MAQALADGKEVCFDATNTTRSRRRPLIRIGKQTGAVIEAVVFLNDLETLVERNAQRPPGKKVTEDIIKNWKCPLLRKC